MTVATVEADAIPLSDEDLFAPEALRDPFPLYRRIRDLGPVVRLKDPGVYALARFEDVKAALRAPERLVSGAGVGFNEIINEPRAEPSMIMSDGERHQRLRMNVARQLVPKELKLRRAELLDMIRTRVAELVGTGWIDGVAAVAQHLPITAVSHLVGLPPAARQNMLRWASAGFNVIGARTEHLGSEIATFREGQQFLLDVDLLHNLGMHEDQGRLLKAQPELLPSAVLESVRHSAVVRWFSRAAASRESLSRRVRRSGLCVRAGGP